MKITSSLLLFSTCTIPVVIARCASFWDINENASPSRAISGRGKFKHHHCHQGHRSSSISISRSLEEDWHEVGKGFGVHNSRTVKKSLTGYAVASSQSGDVIAISSPVETFDETEDDGVKMTIRHPSRVQVFQFNPEMETWEQPTPDIERDDPLDDFGVSLALDADGSTVVVGSLSDSKDKTMQDVGSVNIYTHYRVLGESVWKPKGVNFRLEGSAAFDQFGASVDISEDGNMIAVGSPMKDIVVNDILIPRAGEVTVWKFDTIEEEWSMVGTPMHGEMFDRFGSAVSLSSKGLASSSHIVAIGAPTAGLFEDGYVKIFRYNEVDPNDGTVNQIMIWDSQPYEKILGSANGDHFGSSVALSMDGNSFVAGAPRHRGYDLKNKSGHAKVYIREQNGHWKQRFESIVGFREGEESGSSVAISGGGKRVAVGSPFSNNNGKHSGHVSMYEWVDQQWNKMNLDIDGDEASDLAGSAVAMDLSGTRVVIGSPGGGYARVYELSKPPPPPPTGSPTRSPTLTPESKTEKQDSGIKIMEIILMVNLVIIPLIGIALCGMVSLCRYIRRRRSNANAPHVAPQNTQINTEDVEGEMI